MITGEIKKILTQKDNDWGRYEITNAGKKTLAVGIIPNASIGMLVTLEGAEEVNKYGRQFKISSVVNIEADKNAGVVRFLADGYVKYIGLVKARAIANAFGADALSMFETEEGRTLLSTVKGLGIATIEKALPSFEENKKYKDIVLFLNGTGTKLQVKQIYEKYGDDAIKILKKNPYVLQTDLDGFGFIKADNLAMGVGIKPDSIYRLQAAVYYCIETAQSAGGHCFLTVEEIRDQITHILCPMPKFPDDTTEKTAENAAKDWTENREKFIKKYDPSAETLELIDQTVESRNLILETLADAITASVDNGTLVNDYGRIYTAKMYNVETGCAEMLKEMMTSRSVRFINKEVIEQSIKDVEARKTKEMAKTSTATFVVTEEQRKAVYLGLMNRVSIISGGPGRGKTAIAEIIAESFLNAGKRYDKKDIIMLAPTGRAAQRMTESTGYDAMTAHRAIAMMEKTGEAPHGKLILCDESSMVDIFLMYKILKFAKDCNIIFIGDVDQIASVGPGRVLADMIDSEVIPCILLKQGHRNSGTIAHNSELINAGMKIDKYCYDEHFIYIPATSDNITKLMVADYKKKVDQYGITNVMLCSAMRERGAVSVNRLNNLLQDEFTRGNDEAVFGTLKFRVGDRVMQTKNDYNFEMRRGGEAVLGIFNGERGTVQKIMPDPENDSYKMVVKFDDGSVGGYTKATAVNLSLAYATTLHKCQGSEAACMMMAYTFGDYILLNRSLFYTGETRAKKEFRFYGEEKFQYGRMLSAFDIAVGKTDDNLRHTALSERIKEAV